MDFLSAVIGISLILWVFVAIRTHAGWVAAIFVRESEKIRAQGVAIRNFGYRSINSSGGLASKRGLVFAYWEKDFLSSDDGVVSPRVSPSPTIFSYVNFALVVFTSIFVLMVLGKALFNLLGFAV